MLLLGMLLLGHLLLGLLLLGLLWLALDGAAVGVVCVEAVAALPRVGRSLAGAAAAHRRAATEISLKHGRWPLASKGDPRDGAAQIQNPLG